LPGKEIGEFIVVASEVKFLDEEDMFIDASPPEIVSP
jgi:hypothetical protein